MVDQMEPISALKVRTDRDSVPGYLDFDVVTTTLGDTATVRVVGDLDCATAPQVEAALGAVLAGGARHVVVDLGGTPFVDSTGLSVLVGGLKHVREQGGTLVVRSPRPSTVKLFHLTGLDSVFDVS